MASIQQIKTWIPEAIKIFTTYFPCDSLPEIHIVNERNLISKRNELLLRFHSETAVLQRNEYTSIMELIHGETGDAILIQQKYVLTAKQHPDAESVFYHYLWHELGHYFAIISETTNLHRFNNPNMVFDKEQPDGQDDPIHCRDNRAKQEGYWFWSEFIAEVISNHVDTNWRKNREGTVYRPDLIVWTPNLWHPISDKLVYLLEQVFTYYNATIDEYALAFYFAFLLKDDFCQLFLRAADDCQLLLDNCSLAPKKMKPRDIDPTGIVSQPEIFRTVLREMKAVLEEQVNKQNFWIVTEDWIEDIGEMILHLNNKNLAFLSNATEEEVTAVMSLSKEERENNLRSSMGDEQFEAMMRYAKGIGIM